MLIHFFDFLFRGMLVIGAFVMMFNNFREIRRNRKENENRKVLMYYHTVFNVIPIYLNYITSVLIGLSIFRVGSFLHILQNGEMWMGIGVDPEKAIVFLDTAEIIEFQWVIIAVGIIGCVLYIFLCMLMTMSFAKLGKNLSVNIDIKEGNTLVRSGVYRVIRHPIYLCEMMMPFAVALAMQNWLLILWGFVMVPIEVIRANKEDELLEHHYGESFVSYKSDVNRFFPKNIGRKKWIR
ncbi:MAG: isoprenylcysteine carboxylmethyltransferase family protein [Spirochaetales bacterium]|nr:isoprenylcysteine carboxylmethyltransferase family protein [Spirochaetales bacterium]MBR6199617.1 isoprenylcysteine carboxylmethyltransferase family protein [Spirochaetales bacterium]